ncbi:MAG: YkvA family protein [Variibacter sp.]
MKWRDWARLIRRDAHAVYLAARDPRVPWYVKALALAVAAYAASPIDLIPDFIPVLGYLDDLIIVPLGIALVVRLIPPEIMDEHRALAAAAQDQPISRTAAAVIVVIWIASILFVGWLTYRWLGYGRVTSRGNIP